MSLLSGQLVDSLGPVLAVGAVVHYVLWLLTGKGRFPLLGLSLLSGRLVDSCGPVLAVGAVSSISCAVIFDGIGGVYSPRDVLAVWAVSWFSWTCSCCRGSNFTLLCFDLCRVPVRLLSLGCGGFNLLGLVLALSLLSWQFVCSTWVSSLSSGCSHGPVLAVGAVISLSCAVIYVGIRCVYSPWVAAGLISSGLFLLSALVRSTRVSWL